jgi:C4-dicarboxylate transporter
MGASLDHLDRSISISIDQLAAGALCFLLCFFFLPLCAFLPSLAAGLAVAPAVAGAAAGAAAGVGATVGAFAGAAVCAVAFNEKARTLELSKRARSLFI